MFVGHLKTGSVKPQEWNSLRVLLNLQVLNLFYDIVILTDDIKAAWGPIITGASFISLPYYSYTLRNMFKGTNITKSFLTALSIGSFLVFLLLAAEASAMLREFTASIRETKIRDITWSLKSRLDFHEHLLLVLNKLSNQVGLRGNGFTITYKFVGVVSTLSNLHILDIP
ncbi:unnamed protein product [Allacma fusca]|uniref:Uncharacterized protein n=1 Tax=Allacma fusca TaxID=39272 RepID=A0A8J2PG72_9HEXA|nr:unnamed protein product [Allacma fusca]